MQWFSTGMLLSVNKGIKTGFSLACNSNAKTSAPSLQMKAVTRLRSNASIVKILATGIIASICQQAAAVTTPEELVKLAEQRTLYSQIEKDLQSRKIKYEDIDFSKLEGYPLVAYLEFQNLNNNLSAAKSEQISDFLSRYPDSWLSGRLRTNWLNYLASKKQWQTFANYYDSSLSNTELQCKSLDSRYRQGDKSVLNEVAAVWNEGKSLPKSCDYIFSTWLKSDAFDAKIAWQRHFKAIEEGNASLAEYVSRYISADLQPLAKELRNIYHYPSKLEHLLKLTQAPKEIEDVIHYGVKRYAKYNPQATLRLWEKFDSAYLLETDKRNETTEFLAYRLILKDEPELANRLLERNKIASERVTEKQLRAALSKKNWSQVDSLISNLSTEAQNSNRWQYWRLRAQESLAKLPKEDILRGYTALSGERDFYSFLAAERSDSTYNLGHQSIPVSPAIVEKLDLNPHLQRSRELFLLGKVNQARMEWQFGTRNLEAEDLINAGHIAHSWGWHRKTIESLGQAKFWDDLDLRFPILYNEEFQKASQATTVAPEYLLAIARQESAFAVDARSPAGAMGLMQLMPATANQTALSIGIPYRKSDLLIPEHNILLGGSYLNQMLQKFNGNRILATAAYNAGPHRVSGWLNPQDKRVDFDVWIETIPYNETRRYVQNVLTYSLIYSHLMGVEKRLLEQNEWNEPL